MHKSINHLDANKGITMELHAHIQQAGSRFTRAINKLLIGLLLGISTSIALAAEPGMTPAEFAVGPSGSAEYNVPITVPPGTAGMQPSLSLSYSSQSGNGSMGVGWGLNGLSVITRCAQTHDQDTKIRAVKFDSQDKFCLDGQRLVLAAGGAYGNVGAVYRTEIDNFSHIASVGGSNGYPAGFLVHTKSGQIIQYGYTTNSRIEVAQNNGVVRTWAINRVTDTLGNYISFTYEEDTDKQDFRITRIDYTGNDQVAPPVDTYSSVRFEYIDRPFEKFGYSEGYRFAQRKLLKNIKTYHGESLIRNYILTYLPDASAQVEQTRLDKIQECAADGKCFEPLQFTWSPGTQGDDLVGNTLSMHLEADSVQWVDINGDGRTDFCRLVGLDDTSQVGPEPYQDHLQCNLSNGTGLSSSVLTSASAVDRGYPGGRQWVDFNGDGKADYCRVVGTSSSYRVQCTPSTGTANFGSPVTSTATLDPGYSKSRAWVDMNGDGRGDFCRVRTGNRLSCMLASDNGFAGEVTQTVPLNMTPSEVVSTWAQWKDINSDGLTDFCNGANCLRSTGTGWENTIIPMPLQIDLAFDGAASAVAIADINGDGQADVCDADVTYENVSWNNVPVATPPNPLDLNYQEINWDGTKFVTRYSGNINTLLSYIKATFTFKCRHHSGKEVLTDEVTVLTHEVYSQADYSGSPSEQPIKFAFQAEWVDKNNDGLTDLCLYTNYRKNFGGGILDPIGHFKMCGYSQGNSFAKLTGVVSDSEEYRTALHYTPVDVNGDALPDECKVVVPDSLYPFQVEISCERGQTRPSQRIETFTDSLGNETVVQYKQLTDSSVYQPDANSLANYPYAETRAPIFVVSEVDTSDGIGGYNTRTYQYRGVKTHLKGRGFAGFSRMITQDVETGIRTNTAYEHEFPLTGMVKWTVTEQNDWTRISSIENDNQYIETVPGAFMPYTETSLAKQYEIDGTLIKNTTTVNSVPTQYGNIETITVTIEDAQSADSFSTTTVNDYDDDTNRWYLGRLNRTEVTQTNSEGSSDTRTSAFTYFDNTHGMLKQEIVEPDDPEHRLITEYGYDDFGNTTTVTVSGGSSSHGTSIVTRTTTTDFNADGSISSTHVRGQFPLKVTNAEGEEETHEYDARYGVMTSLTGPNNLTTTWWYDSFGRQYRENRADDTYTRTIRVWASQRAVSPASAVLVEETFTPGQPASGQYSDSLGRVIMTRAWGRVKSLDNNGSKDVVTQTIYNKRGEVVQQSLPYFAGQTPKWKTVSYDDLGRPKTEVEPRENSGTATVAYAYNGLNTTVTDRLGNSTTQRVNARDELVQVTDALGNSTHYRYDPFGNQVEMEDTDGYITYIDYNILGQKIAMNDPDMGAWIYRHDVLGQLVYQRDAKSQETTMVYDKVGRLIERTDEECTSYWVYGSASNQNQSYTGNGQAYGSLNNAKSIGKLVYSQKGDTERTFTEYDQLGRPVKVFQELFGGTSAERTYITRTVYDAYSRVRQVIYPASPDYPTGLVVTNNYDTKGYLDTVTSPDGSIHWEGLSQDAFGNVTDYRLNNGQLTTERQYDAYTGLVDRITTTKINGDVLVQDSSFTFDDQGNLISRTWRQALGQAQYHTENFIYDDLYRLDASQVVGLSNKDYQYFANGNIKYKPGVGTYTYGQNNAGPHAVTSTTYNGNTKTYTYDSNGNMLSGDGRTLSWSAFNKPTEITQGANYSQFVYGVDRQRIWQKNQDKTIYYAAAGFFEEEIENATTTYVHYIKAGGQTVATIKSTDDSTPKESRYLLRDHLGSVEGVTDETGALVEQFSYDAFGKRRNHNGTDASSPLDTQNIARGFTGHEHLDNVGIIHMNGRVYDPTLGRFMSADPFIQAPTNSQSLNRYSYVLNNPLSLTDPSGFFFKRLFKSKFFRIASAIVLAAVLGPNGLALTGGGILDAAIAGFAAGLAGSGGNLKMGFIGGLTGAAFYGIGSYFEGLKEAAGAAALTSTQAVMKIVAHGLVGGISTDLRGGEFLGGFLSSGVSAAMEVSGYMEDIAKHFGNDAATLAGIIAGGTISVIGGGKFANGALNAAFVDIFNRQAHIDKQGSRNPAIKVANEALQDGHLTLNEANRIWRANNDPNFEVTVDASQLTVTNTTKFDTNGVAKGKVVGTDDWLVHGSTRLTQSGDGSIAIDSGAYDFLPNPRSWYDNYASYAVRNIEAYLGFYYASHAGMHVGTDYTINYSGSPTLIQNQ